VPSVYADASALVKLAVEEPESAGLRRYLQALDADVVTSVVAQVEVGRAVRRVGVTERDPLAGTFLVQLDDQIVAAAVELEPKTLRALDAIHLATAFQLRNELEALVAYDERLLAAAREAGLPTASPG
jgi:predicted nucleic acid-binding protein